jgi:hypothetical protein
MSSSGDGRLEDEVEMAGLSAAAGGERQQQPDRAEGAGVTGRGGGWRTGTRARQKGSTSHSSIFRKTEKLFKKSSVCELPIHFSVFMCALCGAVAGMQLPVIASLQQLQRRHHRSPITSRLQHSHCDVGSLLSMLLCTK